METINTATSMSNAYPVKNLSDFAKMELESNQYLVRKIEKGTGKESKGVIIPAVEGEDFILALDNEVVLQNAIAWYQEQIATCCKNRINAGASVIVPSDYNLAQVVEMLSEQEISEGRVSKEKIAVWFSNALESPLARAFKEKLGESASNDKILEIVGIYKESFKLLAKREFSLATDKRENMRKALELATDCSMKTYCLQKLQQEQKTVEMLGL